MVELGFEEIPIYRLEPGDDVQDLITSLQEAQDPLAVFMDHAEATVLKNPVNLRLLQGYAREGQQRLILISEDPIVQSLAGEEGIECYPGEYELAAALGVLPQPRGEESDGEGESKKWYQRSGVVISSDRNADMPEPIATVSVRRPALQQWLVLAIAMVSIGLLYYALVPKVTVVVNPSPLVYQQTIEILGVVPDLIGTDLGTLPVLPLDTVRAVIETEAVVTATGTQTLGTALAKGVAVFINEGDEAITVPKGTRLGTGEGIVFGTDKAITVPGRSTEYFLDVAAGVRAGQEEVSITAVEPGDEANVAAGRVRLLVDSELGKRLMVRNPEPTRGGASIQQTNVTEDDIRRAEAVCSRQAGLKAGEILQSVANDKGSVVIPESIQVEGISLEPEVSIGDEAQTVKVLARFRAEGQAFRRKDLGELMEQELGKHLPENLALCQPKFEIERLEATLQEGTVLMSADVKAPVHRRLLASDLAKLFAGLSRQEVAELAKILDADSIEIMPREVEHLPRFPHWIRVDIPVPEAAVTGSHR